MNLGNYSRMLLYTYSITSDNKTEILSKQMLLSLIYKAFTSFISKDSYLDVDKPDGHQSHSGSHAFAWSC